MANRDGLVNDIFSSIAGNYNLMNNIMSFGLHCIWKKKFVAQMGLAPNSMLLDVAGGTGDISHLMFKYSPSSKVFLCDSNYKMLEEGRNKALDKNILKINHICARAENLPFQDNTFDCYSISFGIRNISDIAKSLSEALRVLKPGGKFFCLEFTPNVTNPTLRIIYKQYSEILIPRIGKHITGNEAAYRYLVDSIKAFPKQELFLQMILDIGFTDVDFTNLSGGIVAVHSGRKP